MAGKLPENFVLDEKPKQKNSLPEGFIIDKPKQNGALRFMAGQIGRGAEAIIDGAKFKEFPAILMKGISGALSGAPESVADRPRQAVTAGIPGVQMGQGAELSSLIKNIITKRRIQGDNLFPPEEQRLPYPKPTTKAGSQLGKEVELTAGFLPLEQLGVFTAAEKAVAPAVAKVGEMADDITRPIRTITGHLDDAEVDQFFKESIDKGIRPTVVGKNSGNQVNSYYRKARQAVETILESKDELNLVDEWGEAQPGRLPKSLGEFSQAIDQAKNRIFQEYDTLARETGARGLELNVANIADEIIKQVNNKAVRALYPDLAKYATELAERLKSDGFFTPDDAQKAIEMLNSSLTAYYRNPNPAAAGRAVLDAAIAAKFRNALDDLIEYATGESYKTLKQKYSSLRAIQEDVAKRATVDARKNYKGFFDLTQIFATGDIVQGLLNLNASQIAKGAAMNVVREYIKHLNNPNRIVKQMFETMEKVKAKAPRPDIIDADFTVQPAKMLTGPGQKAIEGPAPTKMIEGPKRKFLSASGQFGEGFERVPDVEARKRLTQWMFKYYSPEANKIIIPEGQVFGTKAKTLLKSMGVNPVTGEYKSKPLQSAFQRAWERSKQNKPFPFNEKGFVRIGKGVIQGTQEELFDSPRIWISPKGNYITFESPLNMLNNEHSVVAEKMGSSLDQLLKAGYIRKAEMNNYNFDISRLKVIKTALEDLKTAIRKKLINANEEIIFESSDQSNQVVKSAKELIRMTPEEIRKEALKNGAIAGVGVLARAKEAQAGENGKDRTKRFEGFRSKPYKDVNGQAVGYGFNLDANPEIKVGKEGMTKEEADKIFDRLYLKAEGIAKKYATAKNWEELNDDQKAVLTDLAYNMGNKIYKFKKARTALIENDHIKFTKELKKSKWYFQVGNRAKENIKLFLKDKK